MADVDGSNLVQISHGGAAGFPRWSPDSQKIVFQVDEDGSLGIYVANISERVPRELPIPFRRATITAWSHDGNGSIFAPLKAWDSNLSLPRRRWFACLDRCLRHD